jgi:hypothetical protein
MSLDFKGLAISPWIEFWHLTCNVKDKGWPYGAARSQGLALRQRGPARRNSVPLFIIQGRNQIFKHAPGVPQ